MELEELVREIETGKDEARTAARVAEAARKAAREWAIRLIEKTHPLEARALGRAAELESVSRSPVVAALIILAASGESEAAKGLQALGVRSGIVEVGAQKGRVVITLPNRRVVFEFSPPAACQGVWFRWQAPNKAESPNKAPTASVSNEASNKALTETSVGARARIKRAR